MIPKSLMALCVHFLTFVVLLLIAPGGRLTGAVRDCAKQSEPIQRGEARRDLERRGYNYDVAGFLKAVRRGDLVGVRFFLRSGMDPNAANEAGMPALALALLARASQKSEIIACLLDAGANSNTVDNEGETPLILSLKYFDGLKSVQLLLKAGAEVNPSSSEGATALMFAALASPRAFQELVDKGARVNQKDGRGWTPLMYALSANQNAEMIRTIIRAGGDVNSQNADGETSVFFALEQPDVLKLLLLAGARTKVSDKNGRTPLEIAKQLGVKPSIELLSSRRR